MLPSLEIETILMVKKIFKQYNGLKHDIMLGMPPHKPLLHMPSESAKMIKLMR